MTVERPKPPVDKRAVQVMAEFHARRSPFVVTSALMFGVECKDVTQAQYNAAVRQTEQYTMPKGSK